ncbi:DUF2752 domain-containing protein [Pleurocapsales cyanobacterium LEGE 10410]|nr:DUF2752 domain-containing protein [Pleurocapsales cyanobacterium LEGE 10410]
MFDKRIQLCSIYFLGSLIVIVLYLYDPANSSSIYPPSLSREWGGFYCAGCGMFRALHQLLRGNWQAALRLNPLLIVGLPYLFYWVVPYFFKYFYQLNLYTIRFKNKQIIAIAMVILVYSVLRNISSPLLSWLVPPS